MIHELKTWPGAFAGVRAGLKTCEVRKWDRDFNVGDKLYLREWDPDTGWYTGKVLWRQVTWMTDPSSYGMGSGLVVLSCVPCAAAFYDDAGASDVPNAMRD